jgi:hypothetical protein
MTKVHNKAFVVDFYYIILSYSSLKVYTGSQCEECVCTVGLAYYGHTGTNVYTEFPAPTEAVTYGGREIQTAGVFG